MNYTKPFNTIKYIVILAVIFVFITKILPVTTDFYHSVLSQANLFISILILICIIILIVFIWQFISTLFEKLDITINKINQLLSLKNQNEPEKLLLTILPIVAQIFLIFLSEDFTHLNTKIYLSVMVWVITAMLFFILLNKNKSKIIGLSFILILSGINLIVVGIQNNISSLNSFFEFINKQIIIIKSYSLTDILFSIIIIFSIIILVAFSIYYSFKSSKTSGLSDADKF